jgi:hypothetical protein
MRGLSFDGANRAADLHTSTTGGLKSSSSSNTSESSSSSSAAAAAAAVAPVMPHSSLVAFCVYVAIITAFSLCAVYQFRLKFSLKKKYVKHR